MLQAERSAAPDDGITDTSIADMSNGYFHATLVLDALCSLEKLVNE